MKKKKPKPPKFVSWKTRQQQMLQKSEPKKVPPFGKSKRPITLAKTS
jgi:hypothetical protein